MRCGDKGHTTKAGTLCRYPIIAEQVGCPHHDGSGRARAFQQKGTIVRQLNRLPQNIQVGKLSTTEEIRQTYVDLLTTTLTQKNLERSRLEIAVKILNGASTLLNIEAVKDLNETIMRAEGHGPALIILEGLKTGRLRRLPGLPGLPAQEVAHGT